MLNIYEDIILNREVRQKHIEVVCEHASLRDYADNWGKGVEFRISRKGGAKQQNEPLNCEGIHLSGWGRSKDSSNIIAPWLCPVHILIIFLCKCEAHKYRLQ